MQNLKFKVFYEASGKIYDVLAMDFVKRHVTIEYKKGKTQVVNMDFCKFMQYTGINDHNGVEIYTGNIIKDGFGDIGQISFLFSGFYVVYFDGRTSLYDVSPSEVIGNIYENKELLG